MRFACYVGLVGAAPVISMATEMPVLSSRSLRASYIEDRLTHYRLGHNFSV